VTALLIADPRFRDHETGEHPETSRRLEVIERALAEDPVLGASLLRRSAAAASLEDLARCHSDRLVTDLEARVNSGAEALDADTRISRQSFEVAKLAAGAAILGVDAVMAGEVSRVFAAVRPPGHHASADRAMGFCLFNNVAVAARYAQSRYDVGRVLVVDWDVHHGNGTQDIFYEDPSVFFFSMHQYPWYPGTGGRGEAGEGGGQGATLNLPLPAGTPPTSQREAFRQALGHISGRFRPDLVLVSAGFDSRRGDPLGGLLLEDADFREMTLEVMELAERFAGGRVVSFLEGGYHLGNLGGAVRAHVRALAGLID
jgi:acetoin utilization deacetylase AcuC-like enzyme